MAEQQNGPVSRKIIAQALTNIIILVVAFLTAKQGLSLSPEVAGEIAALASVLGGLYAGWLIRDPGSASAAAPPALPPPVEKPE